MTQLADHLHIDNFRKNIPLIENNTIKGLVREGEQGFIRKGGNVLIFCFVQIIVQYTARCNIMHWNELVFLFSACW